MKQNLKNEHGFTLVELMVVLVILGILASIAVPSFTGYIDKQKKKEAIEECHLVVAAAQSMYDDKLTKNNVAGLTATLNYTEVASLAGVNGTITKIVSTDPIAYDTSKKSTEISEYYYRVGKLTYTAQNGLPVLYDCEKDPKYQIDDSSIYTPLEEYIRDYQQTVKELFASNELTFAYGQRSDYAKAFLKKKNENNGSKDTFLEVSPTFLNDHTKDLTLYWQPYFIANGKTGAKDSTSTLLFATPKNGTEESVHNGWKAYLIYFNGEVYYCPDPDKDGNYCALISTLKDCKSDADVENWLNASAHGFKSR